MVRMLNGYRPAFLRLAAHAYTPGQHARQHTPQLDARQTPLVSTPLDCHHRLPLARVRLGDVHVQHVLEEAASQRHTLVGYHHITSGSK